MEVRMSICNHCGTSVEDGIRFCTKCGEAMPLGHHAGSATPPVSRGIVDPGTAMAPAPNYPQAPVIAQPLEGVASTIEAGTMRSPVARGQRRTTMPIGLITVVAVVACAVAMYVVLKPSPTSQLAAALRSAVKNGRLVTLAPDDAYTYYFQLRGVNATHPVLREIAPQVLPQLRSLGEAALHKKMTVQVAQDTLQGWTQTLHVFAWAHALEP